MRTARSILFLIYIFSFLFNQNLKAQVSFIKDPNLSKETYGSYPVLFTEYKGEIYFAVRTTSFRTTALIKSDGISSEVTIVKDGFFNIAEIVATNQYLYFIATSFDFGKGLWRSDGTEEGTKMVKEIIPHGVNGNFSHLKTFKNYVIFTVYLPEYSYEPWVSDGTEDGTHILKDLEPGANRSVIYSYTSGENYLFFVAKNSSKGIQLWRTDGTSEGTIALTDVTSNIIFTDISQQVTIDGITYFMAYDSAENGFFIWQTDGTIVNTKKYSDEVLISSLSSRTIVGPIMLKNALYFIADDGYSWKLWKKAQIDQPYELIAEKFPGHPFKIEQFLATDNRLFMIIEKKSGERDIWSSDGTMENTKFATKTGNVYLGDQYLTSKDKLYFVDNSLWVTDGTAEGTSKISPEHVYSAGPRHLIMVQGNLFFPSFDQSAKSFRDYELFKSEGTVESTALLADINTIPLSSGLTDLSPIGNTIFFNAYHEFKGGELWISDGTEGGTRLIADIFPGIDDNDIPISAYPHDFIAFNDQVYFSARHSSPNHDDFAQGLWKSDGTKEGTILVKDITLNRPAASYKGKIQLNNKLYFYAREHGERPYTLWSSDGTGEGTVKLIEVGQSSPSQGITNPGSITKSGNSIYFVHKNHETGRELWRTNDNDQITMVKDIFPGKENAFAYYDHQASMLDLNDEVLFKANDGVHGFELWKSNGTEQGTVMIKDIFPGESGSGLTDLTLYNGLVYFLANTSENNRNLWKSDGTPEGTQTVKDVGRPDVNLSHSVNSLIVFKNLLFFRNDDDENGTELWRTDGTSEGTFIFRDLYPGIRSTTPENFTTDNDIMYFTGRSDEGTKIWKTDGIPENTFPIEGFEEAGLTFPENLVVFNGDLYFTAADPMKGQSLFKYRFVEKVVTAINTPTRDLFLLFPNPSASGELNLQIPKELQENLYEIQIFDLMGKRQNFRIVNKNSSTVRLQLSNSRNGIYILRLSSNSGNFSQRFISY